MASSAAAGPTSGFEPAPRPSVTCSPIWMMRSAFDEASAWASVLATMKSTPARPETIMLLTALPPAPPTPHTMIRGFNSRNSGAFRLMVISWPHDVRRPPAPVITATLYSKTFPRRRFVRPTAGLKTFLQPPPHARHITALSDARREALAARLEMLDARNLRIDHQTDCGREGGALGRFGQTLNAERTADADLVGEDGAPQGRKTRQLASPARKHQPPPGVSGKPGRLEPIAHELQDLFDARADDADQFGFGQVARVIHVVADPMHRNGVAFIGGRGDAGAIERLQSLRVRHADRQPARDVHRDVV